VNGEKRLVLKLIIRLICMLCTAELKVLECGIRPTTLLLLSYLVCPTSAHARDIWLVDRNPIAIHDGHASGPPNGAIELFGPQARWPRAAKEVSVLKVTAQFLFVATDDDLSLMFRDIKQRHIEFAVELGFLSGGGICGKGVEGFANPASAATVAQRVRALGGELNYLAMDEPLHFGRDYDGPNACKFSTAEVARIVAVHIKEMRQIFPGLQVGDIEPIGSVHPKEAADEIMQWTAAYRAAMGEPLAFLHADVQWGLPWEQELRVLAGSLRTAHIDFGIIYDGAGSDMTGIAWTRHAEDRFVAVEAAPALVPDQAILQSWMTQPEQMLPETEPGTMTYLVTRYAASPSRISVQRAGAGIGGRLTDGSGNPIGQATVKVLAVANAKTNIMVVRKLAGVVPAGAASATIGVRINDECGCSGPADVAIGTVVYRDDRSGQTVQREFRQPSEPTASIARFLAAAGQRMRQNTPVFPVTPGHPFTIEMPLSADNDSTDHGYIAIIFLNQEGQGMARQRLPFQPSSESVGTTVTDTSGRFVLPLNPALRNSNSSYMAEFDGNDQYRLSSSLTP
jgi:hypothetical protein